MSHVFMLFGKGGLIGDALLARLEEGNPPYRVFSFDRPKADISSRAQIAPLFKYVKPTLVFNCAGVNDPEICEDAPTGAFAVNSVGPEVLAEECAKHNARFVHVSSCHVFDGKRSTPYSERCRPRPINTLGKSKFEGEKAVAAACPEHLIIRPGWAFHYEKDNILTDWISKMDMGLDLDVPLGHVGSPTYVPDLIEGIVSLVGANARGVFNVSNNDASTMDGLAEAIVQLTKSESMVTARPSKALREWFRAPMPEYTALSTKKYSAATGKKMRPWKEALKECLFEMHRFRP